MKFKGVIIFFTALSLFFFAQIQRGFCKQVEGVPLPSEKKEILKQSLLSLPLYFIKNQGQLQEEVFFYVKGQGKSTYFTKDGIYVVLASKEENQEKGKDKLDLGRAEREEERAKEGKVIVEAIKLVPVGMRESVEVLGEEETPGKVNYFIGSDPSKWKTGIPTYSKVRYKGLYEGIDLVFYGNERELEYDLVVEPGRDYSSIVFKVEGAKEVRKAEDGSLEIVLSSDSRIIQRKPNVYQEIGGERRELEGEFEVSKEELVYLYSFKVKDYDKAHPLIIDPLVLSYSTYLGGSSDDDVYGIAVDASGNAYVTGSTLSTDFPTKNAFQGNFGGGDKDAFVTKFSPQGSLIYSTYLGGSSDDDVYGIAVDASGNAYVTGSTDSTDFPTQNAFQVSNRGGYDAFVTKLSYVSPTLSVLQPNGGQKWKAGFKYAIKWEAPLDSYKFTLSYSTDNKTTWTNIATVLASNRCSSDGTKYTCTYGWTIPAQDGRKPQSFVRVRAFNSSNQVIGTDDSDKAFAIEVLKLTSPNGGETLKVGSTHTITWETYALTKTLAKVILQYSTNGGQSWTNIKTFVGSNPGQFNWTVPNTPSTNCRVRVRLLDSAGAVITSDVSDKAFTIQQ
ncbi:MAG: SBBP repeat-containing protein [Candidatus Micrarchaeia archaeon]